LLKIPENLDQMHNITFVVFTYNEEARIERVIRNFQNFGSILIADNKSTDRTVEIASKYGCDILIREENYDFVENQHLVNLIYEKVCSEWIYWSFADEMLNIDTLINLTEVIKSDKFDIINMDRKNYNNGKFCYNMFHGYTHKVFRKHSIDFSTNTIHGMGVPTVKEDRICTLPDKYFIHHFSSYTASSYLNTINKYTDVEIKGDVKFNGSLSKILWQFSKRLLKNYFFDGGYKAGFTGMESVLLLLCYEWVKNIKLYEQEQKLDRSTIESKNNEIRDSILRDFNQDKQ
jgi:glycosyltransferase involved in cell wall biosynthesis